MKAFPNVFEVLVLDSNATSTSSFDLMIFDTILESLGMSSLNEVLENCRKTSERNGEFVVEKVAGGKKKKEDASVEGRAKKLLDGLRDDKLAFKLSRSLFV